MIKIQLITCLVFCASLFSEAQNIILNPSFEDTYQGSFGITRTNHWVSPTYGSPDLMDSLSRPEYGVPQNYVGFQMPQEGKVYYGLSAFSKNRINSREYLQGKLSKALSKDSIYCFQLFLSFADSMNYAIKKLLGIYFSSQAFTQQGTTRLNYVPQIELTDSGHFSDKVNWVKYKAQYKANGDEKYLTIGNFNEIVDLDTLFIGGGGNQDFQLATYYYIDNLYLGHCDSLPIDTPNGIKENSLLSKIKGYPNPVNEQFTLENNSGKKLSFQLYNLMGSKVKVGIQQSNSKYSFSMGHLPKGIYLLHIVGENERATMKLVKN